MIRSTRVKFQFLTFNNMRNFILINLILLAPTLLLLYTLVRMVPVGIHYIDTMNISVLDANPEYRRLAVVVISPGRLDRGKRGDLVYIFERDAFNKVRKSVFLGDHAVLEIEALGLSTIPFSNEPLKVKDKNGEEVATLRIDSVKEGAVEVIFHNDRTGLSRQSIVIHAVLMVLSFIALAGALGGINDYTQRIVFHEPKNLRYLFRAIKRHFLRSLSVSLFFSIVIGAIAANVYFYIFIISSDISVFIAAINLWMFLFFLLVLFWVYPLLVLSREESIWKVMKKSLFVSFDNFMYTMEALGWLILLLLGSFFTFFLFPGLSVGFGLINTALKEVSSRYSKLDVA
ncbi:MAG: hypothetical protein JSV25_13395 [Spirochaetota bacterium]|nr:MAG: hypothetical protein JSV25_13395 [Spirochaetota bacterium]